MVATSPFDYLNSVLSTKKYMMDTEEHIRDYPPFFVNKGLSQHIDCILYANEMNQNAHLDPNMQYDYYFHSLRKMKRNFNKWAKKDEHKTLDAISKYFRVNNKRAQEYERILNDEQKIMIVEKTESVS